MLARKLLLAAGQVQGVGFRPFVWHLARDLNLSGNVRNTTHGVRIEVQGAESALAEFVRRLTGELPPLARLDSLEQASLAPLAGETGFAILKSLDAGAQSALAGPDTAPCADCLREMANPKDPRHNYAFASCTNCGPRFSIIRALPYDRAATSMACFGLCQLCGAQYADPADRRFHAQPVACPVCGPKIWFAAKDSLAPLLPRGERPLLPPAGGQAAFWAATNAGPAAEDCAAALERAATLLLAGKILALKGLGGFQLACDASNARAVAELRLRKKRPHKALALMAPDAETAGGFCEITPAEREALESPARPITLLARKALLADGQIAPDARTLGVMLPATPLHALLFEQLERLAGKKIPLVMTSANPAGEPLCLGNREALARLWELADGWLLHNRDIAARVDDSVLRAARSGPVFLRRARGYVPTPVQLPESAKNAPCVLGAGAELKTVFCLTRGPHAFLSQHIGDMATPAVLDFYQEALEHFGRLLDVAPQLVVHDLHPDFATTAFAREIAARRGLPCHALQHHAAHAASVLAENNCLEPAICLCLDGSGLGDDGTIWGGEAIYMDARKAEWRRVGQLSTFALPGGDAAARQPWRIAQALGQACGLPPPPGERGAIIAAMLQAGVNCPQTSSCGRLFDAIAALLGLIEKTTYEGQAAIRLESRAAAWIEIHGQPRPWPIHPRARRALQMLDSAEIFGAAWEDLAARRPAGEIAARFHATIAQGFAEMALAAAGELGIKKVGLSGGVLQNAIISRLLPHKLSAMGLAPLLQQKAPPGDGGLALGQAFFGLRLAAAGKI